MIRRKTPELLPDGSETNAATFSAAAFAKNFDLAATAGSRVIATNRAYEICPWADIVASCDDCFYGWHKDDPRYRTLTGLKVMLLVDPNPHLDADVWIVPGRIERCIGSIREGLGHGLNSGYGALMLAIALGCDPIYLVGFDMEGNVASNTQSWWHDGYPTQNDGSCYQRYADEFKWAAASGLISQRVYSLCPTGGLRDTFPRPEPVFVNFYTKGRGYEDHAQRLAGSLERLGCAMTNAPSNNRVAGSGSSARQFYKKTEGIFLTPSFGSMRMRSFTRSHRCSSWADERSGPDIAVHYKDGEVLERDGLVEST